MPKKIGMKWLINHAVKIQHLIEKDK